MSGHQPCGQETGMTGQPGAEKQRCRKPGHKFLLKPFHYSRVLIFGQTFGYLIFLASLVEWLYLCVESTVSTTVDGFNMN